ALSRSRPACRQGVGPPPVALGRGGGEPASLQAIQSVLQAHELEQSLGKNRPIRGRLIAPLENVPPYAPLIKRRFYARDLERTHQLRPRLDSRTASLRHRILGARLLPAPAQERHGADHLQEILQQGREGSPKRRNREGIQGRQKPLCHRREGRARRSSRRAWRRNRKHRGASVRRSGLAESFEL